MEHFKKNKFGEVGLLLTNNPDAYVLQRADNFEIPSHIFDKTEFYTTEKILKLLKHTKIDFIALAGFLWLMPKNLLEAYPQKIVNIHPSLLPKYGGKGMYGDKVYEAVLKANEKESGITIHYVNENFDQGEILYQTTFPIEKGDDIDMIRHNGLQLEHLHYPRVIQNLIKKLH